MYLLSKNQKTGREQADMGNLQVKGSATGPVVWEKVSVGGYEISSQAMAFGSSGLPNHRPELQAQKSAQLGSASAQAVAWQKVQPSMCKHYQKSHFLYIEGGSEPFLPLFDPLSAEFGVQPPSKSGPSSGLTKAHRSAQLGLGFSGRAGTSLPLGPKFSGILGLALPLNSIIAEKIPPVTGNAPDGAAWASNLFSITPVSQTSAARFLSLSLTRPDSDRIPSLLGIGRHPSALVPNPSKINYRTLGSERSGTLFWKASICGISVYVDGVEKAVDIGRSNTGSVFPSAVLDSGVPLILTTTTIANGIYGAIGVSPASNGMYYVPCNKPLNITITVDDRPPIPLHPLDLTAEPPTNNKAQFCVGLIQTADAQLSSPASSIGDMILGVTCSSYPHFPTFPNGYHSQRGSRGCS
ncbi:hypothetical protein CPC08DRAFT_788817 [Agrocybe pediades]|nr:hypothetical protein CPC08DRAFT_788817 [Agrocybe pediades]